MHGYDDELQHALAVLAAPRRYELLRLVLAGGERCVTDLAQAVGLSQSCTTRHLQALQRAGLVSGARAGKRVLFRAAPRGSAAARLVASLVSGTASAPAGRPAPRRPKRPSAARAAAAAMPYVEARGAGMPAADTTPTPPEPNLPIHSEIEDYLL